jgi:ABC-type nitrate/sulfonate/bicarbonate transport system substrate-binding protein
MTLTSPKGAIVFPCAEVELPFMLLKWQRCHILGIGNVAAKERGMKLRLCVVPVIGAFLLILEGSGSCQEIINYGVQPTLSPIHIVRALGLLGPIEQRNNVKIEYRMFSTGPVENQAMAAGELQMASAGMGPAVIATARLPATLVGVTVFNQNAILVPSESAIRTVADLRGKTVAFVGEGAQQYPMLLKALRDVGLSTSDIKLFKTDGAQIPTLLQQKSVDAGITFDPYVSKALSGGYARMLLSADEIMPIMRGHYIANGEYVRNDFMSRRPEIVQDMISANVVAIDFIIREPEKAAQMWSAAIGLPLETIQYSLKFGISAYNRNLVPDRDGIEAYVKFLKEGKILSPADDPKVDVTFANKALEGK